MALARVVTFDGVSKERMDELDREMRDGQPRLFRLPPRPLRRR